MISFQLDATPICGLAKSSSPMPTARSMPAGRGLLQTVGDVAAARLDVRCVAHDHDPTAQVSGRSLASGPWPTRGWGWHHSALRPAPSLHRVPGRNLGAMALHELAARRAGPAPAGPRSPAAWRELLLLVLLYVGYSAARMIGDADLGTRDGPRRGTPGRRALPAHRRRELGEPDTSRRTSPGRPRELLVRRPPLPRHPGRAFLRLPLGPARLPAGAQHPGGRQRPRAGRLHAAPDGAAPDAPGLRRHSLRDVGQRMVGIGRERPEGPRRDDERARRHALPARRLGPVVHLGHPPADPEPTAAPAGRHLLGGHHGGRRRDRQPLPARRGRRRLCATSASAR